MIPTIKQTSTTRYRAFGLEIDSELELPEFLPGSEESDAADVVIRFGDVSPAPASTEAVTEWAKVSPDGVWLQIDAGDHYLVENGTTITIDPDDASDDATRLVYLLASGFGALLQQRGLLTMHCGAIATDHGVVGFLGPSGIGKSTTTSAMVAAGHPLMTDDILAIDMAATPPVAIPAFPAMKVCRDVLDRRGDTNDYASLPSPRDKYRVPAGIFAEGPATVRAFYVLRRAKIDTVEIGEQLPQARAFRLLEREAFRRRFARPMGRRAELFVALTTIASNVPVHVIRRPADRDTHDELVAAVQAHLSTSPQSE